MTLEPITVTTVLATDPASAFAAFTDRIGDWWPLASHTVSAMRCAEPARGITIEPFEGGRILETDATGEIHHWGSVTDWQPGRRLALAWHVGGSPETATTVTVDFARADDGRTVVTLVHSDWDKLGDRATAVRDRNAGANGWPGLIGTRFAAYVHATCPPIPT
jgi:uncharacterized protein YndB with AHSA1/START domain